MGFNQLPRSLDPGIYLSAAIETMLVVPVPSAWQLANLVQSVVLVFIHR